MLDIINKTPFEIEVLPGLDKDGYEYAITVIKGTFDIIKEQDPLPISENQIPIVYGDEFYGEPGKSSIKYESDTCLKKKGTDIILIGHAFPKNGKAMTLDVALQVGQYKKTVSVFGTRIWHRSMGAWKASPPLPFDKMPLIYEKAFGGEYTSHPDPQKHSIYRRNPIGIGHSISGDKETMEGLPLPNLEDPRSIIRSWKDKPMPANFGFIGRNWLPRVNYAGTYDEKWQSEQSPLLPSDFDDFYFNGAHPDLITKEYLKGGEFVRITNASKYGDLIFKLPHYFFDVDMIIQGKEENHNPVLDTVIIEPDRNTIALTWRATIPTFRKFLFIEAIRIKQTTER